jgi:hypothetical protein
MSGTLQSNEETPQKTSTHETATNWKMLRKIKIAEQKVTQVRKLWNVADNSKVL